MFKQYWNRYISCERLPATLMRNASHYCLNCRRHVQTATRPQQRKMKNVPKTCWKSGARLTGSPSSPLGRGSKPSGKTRSGNCDTIWWKHLLVMSWPWLADAIQRPAEAAPSICSLGAWKHPRPAKTPAASCHEHHSRIRLFRPYQCVCHTVGSTNPLWDSWRYH